MSDLPARVRLSDEIQRFLSGLDGFPHQVEAYARDALTAKLKGPRRPSPETRDALYDAVGPEWDGFSPLQTRTLVDVLGEERVRFLLERGVLVSAGGGR